MATTRAWVRFCGVDDFDATRIRASLIDSDIAVVSTGPTEPCGIQEQAICTTIA